MQQGRIYKAAYARVLRLIAALGARAARSYGVAYWHARFPHWPVKVRKH